MMEREGETEEEEADDLRRSWWDRYTGDVFY